MPATTDILNGLVVTDLHFPGGPVAVENREFLKKHGATVVPSQVDAYDFMYGINRAGVYMKPIDLTITYGMCYSSFKHDGSDMIETNSRHNRESGCT